MSCDMNWEDIRMEYETSKLTLKELAEKHDIKLGTIKSRKSREKWIRGATKKDATPNKKVATKQKKDASISRQLNKEKEVVVESNELTDKQRLFCLYYTKYFSAIKAYQKAYDCNYKTAHSNAYRLMANEGINSEIQRMKEEQARGVKLDAQFVLQKYIDIALSDITDFAIFGKKEVQAMGAFGPLEDENGDPIMVEINYLDFKESSNIDGTIITEVKKGKDGVSVKLADKMKALEKLSLYFDLFPDKFKRDIEEEKLKIAQFKANGKEEEEFEDDGFIEALDGKEVNWDEEA